MNEDGFLKSGKLKKAFDIFDVDKSGYITKENLKVALSGFLTGKDSVDKALMAKIVREVDLQVSPQLLEEKSWWFSELVVTSQIPCCICLSRKMASFILTSLLPPCLAN